MADHRFDVGEVDIGGDARIGQHVLGVEDVQALVFHGAHVEVAHRHDHEAVQVEIQAEALHVPGDAVLERLHGVLGLVEVALFHPHLQQRIATRVQAHGFFLADQLAGHQGEQVRGLLERILPLGVVAAIGQVALLDQVAVGQQHRIAGLVSAQHDGEFGHHVRAVREVGDLAEAFGFALGEEIAVGHVQAHERGIAVRMDQGLDLKGYLGRGGGDGQHAAADAEIALGLRERLAVQAHGHQFQLFAEEHQVAAAGGGVAGQGDAGGHTGISGIEVETHLDGVSQVIGSGVVFTVDRLGRIGAHGGLSGKGNGGQKVKAKVKAKTAGSQFRCSKNPILPIIPHCANGIGRICRALLRPALLAGSMFHIGSWPVQWRNRHLPRIGAKQAGAARFPVDRYPRGIKMAARRVSRGPASCLLLHIAAQAPFPWHPSLLPGARLFSDGVRS